MGAAGTREDALATRLQSWIHGTSGSAIFLFGVVLRILSIWLEGRNQFISAVLGDLGAVTIAAIALPFLYERLLKTEDQRMVANEFSNILDQKLANLGLESTHAHINDTGRLSLDKKLALMQTAHEDIVQLGIRLHTFVGYFENRASSEFKQPITQLLSKGVNITVFLLNPDSEAGQAYARLHRQPNLLESIKESIRILQSLQQEFGRKGLNGTLTIYLYNELPYGEILMIDKERHNSAAAFSPYLDFPDDNNPEASRRANNPTLIIHRGSNPQFFARLLLVIQHLQDTARILPSRSADA
jgi:hypothetical protein